MVESSDKLSLDLETGIDSWEGDMREISTDCPINLKRLEHIVRMREKAVQKSNLQGASECRIAAEVQDAELSRVQASRLHLQSAVTVV